MTLLRHQQRHITLLFDFIEERQLNDTVFNNMAQITLAQLLNHTSGVKSYTGIAGYMGNPVRSDLSTAELVKVFKDLPPDFTPGAKWAYNNSGYVLVGAVVEAISGKSWHESIDSLLLQPARISSIHYPAGDRLLKGMAQGYTVADGGRVVPAGLISMTQPHAAGARVLWVGMPPMASAERTYSRTECLMNSARTRR